MCICSCIQKSHFIFYSFNKLLNIWKNGIIVFPSITISTGCILFTCIHWICIIVIYWICYALLPLKCQCHKNVHGVFPDQPPPLRDGVWSRTLLFLIYIHVCVHFSGLILWNVVTLFRCRQHRNTNSWHLQGKSACIS